MIRIIDRVRAAIPSCLGSFTAHDVADALGEDPVAWLHSVQCALRSLEQQGELTKTVVRRPGHWKVAMYQRTPRFKPLTAPRATQREVAQRLQALICKWPRTRRVEAN